MKFYFTCIFLISAILIGYSQDSEIRYFYNENFNADLETIQIKNYGNKEIEFSLRFNNNEFFKSSDEIIDFIVNMEDEFEDEPIVRKVWRFSRVMRYHNVPLAEHCWYSSNPTVMFNSTGFGFCGDIAAINYILWNKLGFKARYWALGGVHVVSEVFNNEKWEMYDSDVEVYYLNRNKEVASVNELASDSSLILDPVFKFDFDTSNVLLLQPLIANYANQRAYSEVISRAYKHPYRYYYDENAPYSCLIDNYTEPSTGYNDKIILPPFSKLEFLGKIGNAPVVSPYNRDSGWEIKNYANLRLTIDQPWSGSLNFLPLIIQDIKGSGTIKVIGNNGFKLINDVYEIGSDELNTLLKLYWMPLDGLELHVEGKVQIDYLVNKKLFPIDQFNYLFLEGEGIEGLKVEKFQEIPNLPINFMNETSQFCEGESVDLIVKHLPGFKYQWYYNEDIIYDVNKNKLTAKENGEYSVKLTSPWDDEIILSKSYSLIFYDMPELELSDFENIYTGEVLDLAKEVKNNIFNLDPNFTADWFFNGENFSSEKISNSGTNIYNTGYYHFVVSNGRCTKQSSETFIRVLYPENDFNQMNVSIFPNPFQEYINIEKTVFNDGDMDLKVEMFNSLGKKIKEFDVSKNVLSAQFDVSDLSNDLYLLRIVGKETRTIRLIKK
ncbi:MAG: T9SS type A sorting domain-containing protein [Bacteroidota bacterium]|nr:T9SS type A sorting domain-containing protein [Bacteroidota bacterium]